MWLQSVSLKLAAKHIQLGRVVAYPTEAVWGLGCDPYNQQAVETILRLKKRDVSKGLILVAADMQQLGFLLHDLSEDKLDILKQTWPGPNTWIIPHKNRIPLWVSGQHNGVAVRVSSHPLVSALCKLYGGPIISTSANPLKE